MQSSVIKSVNGCSEAAVKRKVGRQSVEIDFAPSASSELSMRPWVAGVLLVQPFFDSNSEQIIAQSGITVRQRTRCDPNVNIACVGLTADDRIGMKWIVC